MTLTAMKSILTGIGGALILAVFFTTFLPLEKVLVLMPGILGFNGLMVGYRLVETLRNRLEGISLFSFVMGLGEGAAVFVAVNLLIRFTASGFSLSGSDLMIYLLVTGTSSYLGARLAVRFFNL